MEIRELKERTKIEDVVARHIQLQDHGSYLVGRCPFHQDGGRPNFVVYRDSQSYICFVCGAKGDMIDFVAQIEGVAKGEAIRRLGDGIMSERRKSPRAAALQRAVESGNAETVDAAYQALLDSLHLSLEHEAALLARGLSTRAIQANGYRTLPEEGRRAVVDALLEGGVDLAGVPGFAVSRKTGRWWLYGRAGLLIPVRGLRGRITGVQVRADQGDAKYAWLSTPDDEKRYGGGASGAPCHVAGREFACAGKEVWVTEGPLKADVTAHFWGATVLGVAGVTAWRNALPIVRAIKTKGVILAFDRDASANARGNVCRQEDALVASLVKAGVYVQRAVWREGKGIDDALLAGGRILVECQPPSAEADGL